MVKLAEARISSLWIAFRFCIFVLWTQWLLKGFSAQGVVNCFQILYIRSLNTIISKFPLFPKQLWIAFRFCIFVLWTQSLVNYRPVVTGCELLSDFVYSFFEHNQRKQQELARRVVNCFQILYIRSLNTIWRSRRKRRYGCELLSDFVYSFFEHNFWLWFWVPFYVVNCFQILYIRSLNTMHVIVKIPSHLLWIAFRFCIFVLWTQFGLELLRELVGCELLSDFVYSFFEHNASSAADAASRLWIAFRFCIFVLWTQSQPQRLPTFACCELLSDFVYSFFEHNTEWNTIYPE